MPIFDHQGLEVHWQEDGSPTGEPIVFAHALGTNLRVWDAVFAACPELSAYRLIRYDIRGHGKSSTPPPPYTMGALIGEAEALIEHLGIKDCVFVGAHLGGQIAQGLAVKRLDQIRALVLVNTAAKIGIKTKWDAQLEALQKNGMQAAESAAKRWFSRANQNPPEAEHWRTVLLQNSLDGYIGCCHAMSGTDFFTPVSGLRLSTLGLSAYNDTLIPPDLMRDTVELIHGADFQIMPRAAHLSMIEQPVDFGERLTDFLKKIGHGSCSCDDDCTGH
ncbi:alpha/beta fold hydrolase [Halocynthiibacter sp. C4]|uniref:alpha/beta fold hydrolase n=1 Tax=Halocynthiibacter sp. C4 TaxID=2992758 RepID=UPI00237A9710|nr:alpha/beta fold hydrolase [Halocynthiibacter sp. C4]MDE0588638.1 alpha/beta fold hydrolase [Halocynthiibacter sp. C4]